INITMRDSYDGAEATAFLGENEEGDGRVEQYDFTIGSSTDRASVLLNASYTKQEPILAGDREISAVPRFGFGANNAFLGASTTTPFGRFGFGPTGARLPNGASGTLTLIPGRPGTSAADFRPFDGVTDGFNFAPDNYLQTPQERTALYAQARYDITENVSFNATVLYNERRSAQLLAAEPLFLGVGGVGLGRFSIPATNVFNPFGVEVTRAQYRNTVQLRDFDQDVDTFYFGGGFDGAFDAFDRALSWNVDYIYTDNERHDRTVGLFDLNRLRAGLGPSFINAAGVPTCGTPTAPITGCVPINLFGGPDGFTPEMADFAGFTGQATLYKKNYGYGANLTGDLFDLPAGPLAFAAGYEYRREFGFDQPDALVQSGVATGNLRSLVRGGFSLDELYAEFNIPILKDLPFAHTFELALAARYSDYSNFGDTTNPKVGLRWKPVDDLLIRANWSKGFRAPNVSELFTGTADAFPQINDPCSASQNPAGVVAARCFGGFAGVGPVAPGYQQAGPQIRVTVGGNPRLTPEKAETRTLGLVYSPGWLEGLDVYLDWYRIEIENSIGVRSANFIVNDCYVGGNPGACALVTRGAGGIVTDIRATVLNLQAGTEVEGYDLTLSYRFDTRFGRFEIDWDSAYVSYLGELGQPDFNEQLPDLSFAFGNQVGVYFDTNPNWRLKSNLSTHWQLGDWGATLTARYLSALDENCASVRNAAVASGSPDLAALCDRVPGTPQFPVAEHTIDDIRYFDAQLTWASPWDARIAAGVRNLTDAGPPVSYGTFANSFDPQYEVPGRFWYVSYTQKF
ncbi:MAG TPA: TonB-dependent receptor, partial [Candidatus Saccharimonadia bacterium]|nr:TonB-dependent receptor [Candidatus Saccharimonadia bacterium]